MCDITTLKISFDNLSLIIFVLLQAKGLDSLEAFRKIKFVVPPV